MQLHSPVAYRLHPTVAPTMLAALCVRLSRVLRAGVWLLWRPAGLVPAAQWLGRVGHLCRWVGSGVHPPAQCGGTPDGWTVTAAACTPCYWKHPPIAICPAPTQPCCLLCRCPPARPLQACTPRWWHFSCLGWCSSWAPALCLASGAACWRCGRVAQWGRPWPSCSPATSSTAGWRRR